MFIPSFTIGTREHRLAFDVPEAYRKQERQMPRSPSPDVQNAPEGQLTREAAKQQTEKGVATHLASAEKGAAGLQAQLKTFEEVMKKAQTSGIESPGQTPIV